MKDINITIADVEELLNSIDCKLLLWLNYTKEVEPVKRYRLTVYYVDSNMKLQSYDSDLLFKSLFQFESTRNYFRPKINYDRVKLMKIYDYTVDKICKGFNAMFASRIVRCKHDFNNGDTEQFIEEFARYLCIKKSNDDPVESMICRCDIDCDFRNYSDDSIGFDVIQVTIPLVSEGRSLQEQRDHIRKLRPRLEEVAMNSIKNNDIFKKSEISIESLYIYKLYHTRDDMLEFIVKRK